MWNCSSCTLLNDSSLILCALCSTPRSSSISQQTSTIHENAIKTEAATTPHQQRLKKRKSSWTKVSSASSYLQFDYDSVANLNLNSQRNSSVNDTLNYGVYCDAYENLESRIQDSNHKNIRRNLKFNRNSLQSIKPLIHLSSFKRKKRFNKYKITDIFASNASFTLDRDYSENDICNLILNNSTQTQTKIKFLKSIWPHVLRVTTRVLNGSKFRCPICLDEEIAIGRITECGHCFCGMCLLHHLFTSNNTEQNQIHPAIPQITSDEDITNYNFNDLFGYCPLCHDYVSFEQCRPLTVIRCNDYKVGDSLDMILIERRKGEQPRFTMNHKEKHLNVSTFRKFETEKIELTKCQEELKEIERMIPSADPLYEAPYLQLLALQVQQYKLYIAKHRDEYKMNQLYPASELKENIAFKKPEARYRKKKYVYQSADGQLIFLHPHNYNMLKHNVDYNFIQFPAILSECQIVQIESFTQSYELRRKYPFLAFIPVDVCFSFVEVDLSSIVRKDTLKYFEKQNTRRQNSRVEKEKLIKEEVKHKQIVEQQRIAAQKQKYARPQIDINDYNEFPALNDSDGSDSNSANMRSPQTRSWSQITVTPNTPITPSPNRNNSNSNSASANSSNTDSNSKKKKRKRRRSKKRNKINNI